MEWRSVPASVFLIMAALTLTPTLAADRATSNVDPEDRFEFDLFVTLGYLDGDILRFANVPGTEPLPVEEALGLAQDSSLVGDVAVRGSMRLWSAGRVVVQLAHQEIDGSAITDAMDDLELDWLFLEHRFGDQSWLRLGRAPVVFGLRNHLRDDGVDRVFTQLPYGFYRQGDQVTDTVDGLSIHYRTHGRWGLALDAYVGEWELLEAQSEVNRVNAPLPETVVVVDAEDAWGGAAWLEGPAGFRLGIGAQRFAIGTATTARPPGEETDWEQEFGSVEIDRERWLFRVEFRQIRYPSIFLPEQVQLPLPVVLSGAFQSEVTSDDYYAEIGVKMGQKWRLHLRRDVAKHRSTSTGAFLSQPFVAKSHTEELLEDTGLGLTYRLQDNLHLRAEFHDYEAQTVTLDPASVGGDTVGVVLTRANPTSGGSYAIVGASWRW